MNRNHNLSITLPSSISKEILSSKDAVTTMRNILFHMPLRCVPVVASYILKGDYRVERGLTPARDINGIVLPEAPRPYLRLFFSVTEEENRSLVDVSTNLSENITKPILSALESEPVVHDCRSLTEPS